MWKMIEYIYISNCYEEYIMILEVKNLIKRYDDFLAVDDFNISIGEGEIFGLLGPNGAGKTTIINCITGLSKIDSGEIMIFGKNLKHNEIDIKKHIGIVPQSISLYFDLSAYDNLMYFGGLYGLKRNTVKEYAEEALNFVGLSDKKNEYPKNFSGGMQRRLNIACGILHHPKLIIMDEPTVGIDPQSRNYILNSIIKLKDDGATIIYTSHYMEEIEHICTDIAILDNGRIIARGTKEKLKNLVSDEEKLKIQLSSVNYTIVNKIKEIYGVKQCSLDGNYIEIISAKKSKNLGRIIDVIVNSGNEIVDIIIEKPTLETVFLTLTGRTLRN